MRPLFLYYVAQWYAPVRAENNFDYSRYLFNMHYMSILSFQRCFAYNLVEANKKRQMRKKC